MTKTILGICLLVFVSIGHFAFTPTIDNWEKAFFYNLFFGILFGLTGYHQKEYEYFLVLSLFLVIHSVICFLRIIKGK